MGGTFRKRRNVMAQNIINERWACDISALSLSVPSGGGVVSVPGVGFYAKTTHRTVGLGGAATHFQESDSVFVKRVRLYSPWMAYGAQISQTIEADQIGLLLEDSSHSSVPNRFSISSFSNMGEWVDVNTVIPKRDDVSGLLTLYPLIRGPVDMIFPASIPADIVGRSVYLYLQIELAHTLPAVV